MQPIAERSEFEHKRIVAAVQRGDIETARRLLGPIEGRELTWGITIALAVLELQRTAARPRCRKAIERAYTDKRLLKDRAPGEDAGSVLCEMVITLMSAKQPWRVVRMAERIARDGGTDEGAVGLLAGRLARTHSVALAACLHELDPAAGGPVSITELTLAELRGVDGPPHTHKPLLKQSDDEHAVDVLENVAGKVNAIGETCRMNVTKCDTFVYRARAVGLAARRRMTSRASRQDQARRLRETIDTGLRNLYRTARLRHADATDRRRRRPDRTQGTRHAVRDVHLRPDSALASSLDTLEAEAADPAMPGHFARWRACHTTRYDAADVVCAGFYERHHDRCTLLQLARRLGGIVEVDG